MGRVNNIYNAKLAQVQGMLNSKLSSVGLSSSNFATVLKNVQQSQNRNSNVESKYQLKPYYGTELAACADENKYNDLIEQAAQKYDLDPNLLKAIMRNESRFKNTALSSAGAQGLMQLMPSTCIDMGVEDPSDPAQNIDGGAMTIRRHLDRYGDERLALIAYNCGGSRMRSYGVKDPDNPAEYNKFSENLRNYAAKVMRYRDTYKYS